MSLSCSLQPSASDQFFTFGQSCGHKNTLNLTLNHSLNIIKTSLKSLKIGRENNIQP